MLTRLSTARSYALFPVLHTIGNLPETSSPKLSPHSPEMTSPPTPERKWQSIKCLSPNFEIHLHLLFQQQGLASCRYTINIYWINTHRVLPPPLCIKKKKCPFHLSHILFYSAFQEPHTFHVFTLSPIVSNSSSLLSTSHRHWNML